MSDIQLADRQPYIGDIVAAIDESSPAAGAGIYYVIATAITLEPEHAADIARGVIGERPRPFHWRREGPKARNRMIEAVIDLEIMATANWRSVGRKQQSAARAELLADLAQDAASSGTSHLIIESGDATTNQRDRSTLLDTFRSQGGVPFHYDWRSKSEPLLWIADAISGVVADHVTDTTNVHHRNLEAAGLLDIRSM